MAQLYRFSIALGIVLLSGPVFGHAQQIQHFNDGRQQASLYDTQRHLIESTLETIVAVLQEVTLQNEGSGLGTRLHHITERLTRATRLAGPAPREAAPVTHDDLDDLRRLLRDIADQLEALRRDLENEERYALAERLDPIQRDLGTAVRAVEQLAGDEPDGRGRSRADEGSRWLRPGRYDAEARREDEGEDPDRWDAEHARRREARERREKDRDEVRRHRPDDWRDGWRHRGWRGYAGTFVGEFDARWPYGGETALYRSAPALRYNRAEGLVLGIGRAPLEWGDYGRGRIYGQLGYAFSLDRWRYEVGLEARLDRGSRRDDFGLKIGGAYRRNTDTRDAWKTSWLENSLAAFFFENDFFDYYEVEGWTVYAVQRLTPYVQLSAGYRQEDYRSLDNRTGWSLFDGDGFRPNPAIDEGRMQSLVFAAEGGRVAGFNSVPRGAAFRLEAEVGDGLGGDFAFTRYVADGRLYLPLSRFSSLGLRLRGGVATGDVVPLQKAFTLGGIGSVRAYAQNAFPGTRMLLGNAEYVAGDFSFFDGWLDDFQLIGFFDAGWVNAFGTDHFAFDDVLPAAGFGLGLHDRAVRLELAWPLRDFGDGRDPTLWLRIAPAF